jgi:hypothetical protein
MTAAKQRLDCHPRVVRKKKPVAVLDDDQARLMFADEKTFRETLFRDFVKFCREHDGVVISVPWQSPAIVLVPLGEPSRLEIALSCLPKYPFVKLPSTAARLSHGVFYEMRQIAVRLWP